MQPPQKLTEASKRQLKDRHCVPCEGGTNDFILASKLDAIV
jgi:hypothetical protein